MTVPRPAQQHEITPLVDQTDQFQKIDRLSLPMQA